MGVIADKIRRAIFGGEVRDSIADGIEVVEQLREDYDNQVINAGNSNAEIVDARGGQTKLKDRLDNFDEQLDNIAKNKTNWINVVEYGIDNTGSIDVTTELQQLIDDNQGKVIYLPTGTYLISQIKLPLATTLQGDGLMSTVIKGNTATDMIVLKDYLSAHVYIKDLFVDGNYIATRGVWAFKEQYSLQYLDNAFVMENVYAKRCTVANVQIGKDDTASIMECKLINVKCEQGKGHGLYLASKCTDSYFEGIYCASNEGNGIYSVGYNLKFVNCKTCWNGTLENKNSGIYVGGGSLQTFINVECQDNYGHGLFAQNTVDFNIQGIFDRNGNGGFNEEGNQIAPDTPIKYGVYLENSSFGRVDIVGTNNMYVHTGKYTQKAVLGYKKCKNIIADIIASHHPYYFINEDDLSFNVDINVNGHRWVNILPSIALEETTKDGVTLKQLNNSTFIINGTSTASIKFDLKGHYGNTTPLLSIPRNSILKVKNTNVEDEVYLLVVGDRTSILSNTKREQYILIESDIELSEVSLSIVSGETLNNVVVMPILEIIPIGSS
ncbi:glycosyl hydrolase family 28-related protein [uncultured Clostridium sp.]|uniref:glycosyl hydrolase family 28-related protein n=1 Tax=uncultured Clostridium sp. TaxID=59620 RepID=UPI0025D0E63B|nr:glycosyl hydrolase family 28-related protein [uncultured Clostridium sp.]MDU4882685.1 glycosyl hydrolase family 28-related protein [Clostridium celatum]MDU7076046.1 glycosyl hydrolase family 28-related protein [Clostridium celatum]